jgi:hypothetical protein
MSESGDEGNRNGGPIWTRAMELLTVVVGDDFMGNVGIESVDMVEGEVGAFVEVVSIERDAGVDIVI